jgi:hypothetical protein
MYGSAVMQTISNSTLMALINKMQLWSVAHFHPHFWVGLLLHPPKSEDGNGQLTRVAFKINNFL